MLTAVISVRYSFVPKALVDDLINASRFIFISYLNIVTITFDVNVGIKQYAKLNDREIIRWDICAFSGLLALIRHEILKLLSHIMNTYVPRTAVVSGCSQAVGIIVQFSKAVYLTRFLNYLGPFHKHFPYENINIISACCLH
jgi:hypothetical protein